LLILSSENHDAPLRVMEYDKGHTGYPVKFISFNNPDDDSPYPSGDMWIIEPHLRAMDDWFKRMWNHTRRSNPKWLFNIKDIPTETLSKLRSNEDLEWVGIEPKSGRPMGEIVQSMQHPPVHNDNHSFLEVNENLLSRIAPKSSQALGGEVKKKTATESSIIQANEMIDLDARQEDVLDFTREIIRDLVGLLERNFQGATDIKGKTRQGVSVNRQNVTKAGFTSNVNIDIEIENMQHPNKNVLRAQMIEMTQTLKLFTEDLARKGKAIDGEFFVKKLLELSNIRNVEQAIVDLNIRNPNKEHEDYVSSQIPMTVQEGEDLLGHFEEHSILSRDQVLLPMYEARRPGFTQDLQNHIIDTTEALKRLNPDQFKKIQNPTTGIRPEETEESELVNDRSQ